jgi:hypothetical protein
MEKIIRVFPRRTKATPTDEYAFIGHVPMFYPDADEVRVSVTFTWDLAYGHELADEWAQITGLPTSIGGPATGKMSRGFTPGLYLKTGNTITSRGCPNRCWFCSVWKRDGNTRELPIWDGWNVIDDNLLACSEGHIRKVFAMLKEQPRRAEFTGGLEASRLKSWHVDLLADLKPNRMYFAYDTSDDLEPLHDAGVMLEEAGLTSSHRAACYVLIGYPGDTTDKAEQRLQETIACGFFPFAMLWRDHDGKRPQEWIPFQRQWTRPQIIAANMR